MSMLLKFAEKAVLLVALLYTSLPKAEQSVVAAHASRQIVCACNCHLPEQLCTSEVHVKHCLWVFFLSSKALCRKAPGKQCRT